MGRRGRHQRCSVYITRVRGGEKARRKKRKVGEETTRVDEGGRKRNRRPRSERAPTLRRTLGYICVRSHARARAITRAHTLGERSRHHKGAPWRGGERKAATTRLLLLLLPKPARVGGGYITQSAGVSREERVARFLQV